MYVYIAGPYTEGDQVLNLRRVLQLGEDLVEAGFTPFLPHLSHFWHLVHPHKKEFWMRWDIEWLKRCEVLFRLPGRSEGAQIEMEIAEKLEIPIVYSIEQLIFLREGRDRNSK
jgi:hypothetical protein